MQCKPNYPGDFNALLQTALEGAQLERLEKKSPSPPIFVYDQLMLPTVLKYFLEIPQLKKVDMVHASLPEYKLWHSSDNGELGLPTIKPSPSPSAMVEGMLVFGLTPQQRSAISDFECAQLQHTGLQHVKVQVPSLDRAAGYDIKCQKPIDAGAFVWDYLMNGLRPLEGSFWPVDDFVSGQLYGNVVRFQYSAQGEDNY